MSDIGAAAKMLQTISTRLISETTCESLYLQILDAASTLMTADAASLQMLDTDGVTLLLLNWRNFHPSSAAFWQRVTAGAGSTCGKALRDNKRVVVGDIESCEFMAGTEDQQEYRRSSIRAVQSTPLCSRSGRPLGMLSTHWHEPHTPNEEDFRLFDVLARQAADLIERTLAEEATRESEERFRLITNTAPVTIWMTGTDKQCTYVNQAWLDFTGCPLEAALGSGWTDGIHPEDVKRSWDTYSEAFQRREPFQMEYRTRRHDGEHRWFRATGVPRYNSDGSFGGYIGSAMDVSERRLVEERDRTLQLLLETAPQGILSIDARGVIVTANRTLEKMFGWATGELIGQSVEHLVPPAIKDHHAAHRAGYFRTPHPRLMAGSNLLGQRKDGSTFPIEINLNHVTNEDGGHAIAFVTDTSERKRDQEALQRSHAELERRALQLRRLASQLTVAEQSARKQLASTLHDGLQQSLFIAWMTLDQLVKCDFQDHQLRLLLRARADVMEATEAARTLSMNLFPPVLHVGGLPAGLDWLAKRTKEQYSVVVSVTADPRANPEASDVRILLFEAVRELLFNAVKHAHVDRVDVKLALGPDETIHIQVSDEGLGFDPTVTLQDKDLHKAGLGLFSIQERLALLGGHLHIQSAPGKGSQFSITLPRTGVPDLTTDDAGARTPGRPVLDSASGTLKYLRILIVDDHAVARAGLRELFSQCPALRVVGEAADGVEAISQAMALQPHVIVMDVSMPQMNGIEATREIHGALPHIRIVGLSTHDDENSERLMRQAGAEAYFTKNEGADRLLDYLLFMADKGKGAT